MIDTAAVDEWMAGHGLGEGPIADLRPIPGGSQNVMVRFSRGGREYVLRRGPEHLRPRSNASILRETVVLGALADTPVAHPRLIAACDDPHVLGGAVFYLMEPVDGFNASVELPASHAGREREMALAIVDALAELGAVDHEAVGLGDFGRPQGFIERQVPRWLRELESFASDAYTPDLPGVEELATWLDGHRPPAFTAGIMHGDFHAANVMFSAAGPEVAAIVDWEMATIGDPLLDLGWLLASWRLEAVEGVFAGPLMRASDLPEADALAARYAERSERDLTHLRWYTVLACFKLGILLEGTHARAHAGMAPTETGEQLHATTLALFARAEEMT